MLNILQKYRKDVNMYNNILGTAAIKGVSLLLGIITINAYNHFFCGNSSVVGAWLTVISILTWVVNFDLGLGNGLRNRLVRYIADNDIKAQKICISSAYILISTVSIIIAVIFCIVIRAVNWNLVINIPETEISNNDLVIGIQIIFIGLIIQFVLKLVTSILYALKKTALGTLPVVLTNFLVFIFAFAFSNQNAGTAFKIISLIYAISMVVPLIVATCYVFSTKMKFAKPNIHYYDRRFAIDILSLGLQFFGVQILLLIINSTNEIIITQLCEPSAVVQYSMYFKMFSAIIALYSVIINPVWSSVSESFYKKDYKGILVRKRAINIIAAICIISTFIVALLLPVFFKLFYGTSTITVYVRYALLFAVFSSVMILVNSTSCIENGINDLKPQIFGNAVAALLKIPICLLLSRMFKDWIFVVVVNLIIMFISFVIQRIGLSIKLKTIKSEWEE